MFDAASLLDLHARTHRSLGGLLDHCAGITGDELARELEGFGYSTVRHQLHHAIGSEEYWVGVLRSLMLVADDPANLASIDALRAFRRRVADATTSYLQQATEAELNTPREMTTWGGHQRVLMPAHVILRTQTHIYQHQGQVAAMCRLLGRPIPRGLDFPLI